MTRIQPLRRAERIPCSLLIWTVPLVALFTVVMVNMFNGYGFNMGITVSLNVEQFKLPPFDYMKRAEYIANLPVLIKKVKDVDDGKFMEVKDRYEVICNPSWKYSRAMKMEEPIDESTLHADIFSAESVDEQRVFGNPVAGNNGIKLELQPRANLTMAQWLKETVELGSKFNTLPRHDTERAGVRYLKQLPYMRENHVGKHFVENYMNHTDYEDVVFDFDKMEFNIWNGLVRFSDNSFKDWTTKRYAFYRTCLNSEAVKVVTPRSDNENLSSDIRAKNIRFLGIHGFLPNYALGRNRNNWNGDSGLFYESHNNELYNDPSEHIFIWRHDVGGFEDVQDPSKYHLDNKKAVKDSSFACALRMKSDLPILPGKDITEEVLMAPDITDYFECYNHWFFVSDKAGTLCDIADAHYFDHDDSTLPHDEISGSQGHLQKKCSCKLVPNLYTEVVSMFDSLNDEIKSEAMDLSNRFAFFQPPTEEKVAQSYDVSEFARQKGFPRFAKPGQEAEWYRFLTGFRDFFGYTLFMFFMPVPNFLRRIRWLEWHKWYIRQFTFILWFQCYIAINFMILPGSPLSNYCYINRRKPFTSYNHGPLADTDPDVPGVQSMGIPSLPGLACDFAKGIELLWLIQRVNYYIFLTTFFWINGTQAKAIYNVVYTKVRHPWPAQFRGIKPTNFMILILFPFTLINLVRYEWVSYGREISGLTTQLMWQEEVNCDMTTRENCLLQGLNSRDHIRFYYDDGYLGKNMPQPLQPHMEFSHRDTLFPTDYSGGMQRARAAVLLDENYTPRGKTYFSLFSKLENQKYFLQNMHRQYANYGILMMLFWITGFGKNGLLSNKIAKIHQAQNRRLILCVFLFVFTTVMRIEYFFAKFYVDKDQGGWSLWVFIAQIALKVFAKFLPACYMVHAYCGIVARLTTTHSLYKAINLGNLIFKSVWFVLAPAMFLIELKDIKFSGWHFQAAKLTEAADAMKLFYETNTANGNFEKTYSAAHFYVPDGRTANVTLNGETNFWPSTFLTDQFSTIVYSMAQTITNTGFGDMVPTSVVEILLACFILLFGWFVLMNRMVDLFYNQLKSSLKVSDEGLGDPGKDYVNQVYDHEELNVFPTGVKKEVDYILMETLCCQNRSKIFSKLRLPELKIMGQGLKFHTLHANEVMKGGDGFVMFIKSGQWELHIVDLDVTMELNYSDHQVFFEQGCVHNKMQAYEVICTSEFGEIYTIDRQHIMRTVENVRFGHGKYKCEVEGVVGFFQPLYETKHEKKERKKLQKELKNKSSKKVAEETEKMTEEEKAKQENFDVRYEEMKAERKRLRKEEEAKEKEKKKQEEEAKATAMGKVAVEKSDAEKAEKKKKKKEKKEKKTEGDKTEGEKTEGEKTEAETEAENVESGEKKKKKKKDKKKATEAEETPADKTENVPVSAEAAAKSGGETDAEEKSEKKDKKEKKEKKSKKDKTEKTDDSDNKNSKSKSPSSKNDSKNDSKDKDAKKTKKKTKPGGGVFTKMNQKVTVGKKKIKTVASDLIEFFPESIELFRWRMFVLIHAVFAFVYTCNKYSFHNSGTEYGRLDWIGMEQSSYWGTYYKFIYPVFFLDFLATLYTGHRDRDNNIVFNPNRQWRRYSWSDLLIKRVFLFSKGVRMLNDEEGMYRFVNNYLWFIPFWPMTQNGQTWRLDKYAWDPLDPLEIEVWSMNSDSGEGTSVIKKIDKAHSEHYFHTMEMMFLGYYYYIILETINSELPRRIGYFKTKVVETCLQVFLLLQVLSTLLYAGSCSTFKDQRARFGTQGPCSAGSWAWLYFDENDLSTELVSSNSKWASTFYLNWKIITGFGSSGITPAYWWTRALLVVSMIAGMLMLAKIVALIKFASNSLKSVTFESNWISIEKALSKICETNKHFYNSLYNAKLNSFNNGLFVQYNPAQFKISDIDLFSDIPKIAMERCNEIKRVLSGQPGQVIIQQDTSVDKFYFLNSGEVQVFQNGESCGFLKAGEVFNLNEMFAERENTCEFKVYTEVELYCWEKSDLKRVLDTVWTPFTMKMKTVCQEKLDKINESTDHRFISENFTDSIKSNHLKNFMKYFYALIGLCLGSALIGVLISIIGSETVELTYSNNQTFSVVKDSWRHQLHSSYSGADYNPAFAIVSYWANCVTNNGGFATRFSSGPSFEKLFEFCVHLAGIVLSLMMCLEMSKMSELMDKIHKSACENLLKIKHMLKSSESGVVEIVEDQITENLMESFDKKMNSQMFKWLPVKLKSELAENLFSEVLGFSYFNPSEAKALASHVEVVRTIAGTFLYKDQLVDHAYFIAEGGFTVSGNRLNIGSAIVFENQAEEDVKSLGKGCVYQIPLKIIQQQAKNDFTSVKYGIFESANEESVVNFFEDDETENMDSWIIKSKLTSSSFGNRELVFACVVSWMISFTNLSRFGIAQDFSDNFVRFDIFYGFAMFGCVLKYLNNKNIPVKSAMASSDKWLFISVIPVIYAPATSVLRAAIFLSNQSQFYKSTSLGMRNYRLVALFFVYLVFCVFATGIQVMMIDSTASKGLFDLEGEVGSFGSSTKSSDLIVFLQYFYSTIDSFTSTGNNTNLRPTSAVCILLHIISAFLGRIYFVTFLAFGKNLIQERLDNIHIDYIKLQTRIVNYMKVAGCHETNLGERKTSYIIQTLEGIYQKTKFLDNKVLTDNLMPGLRRKFNLFEFGSVMRDNSEIFNGLSDACIVEIADRAMVIEHYFAGNLIQEVSSVFKGYMIVLEGSCYVDNNNLFVKGDCMYDDFLKGVEVRAFSQCKLGLIEHEDLEKIIKFYSDDKSTFNKNLEQAVAMMKEEAVLNPIRTKLNIEQRKRDKKKKAEELQDAKGTKRLQLELNKWTGKAVELSKAMPI